MNNNEEDRMPLRIAIVGKKLDKKRAISERQRKAAYKAWETIRKKQRIVHSDCAHFISDNGYYLRCKIDDCGEDNELEGKIWSCHKCCKYEKGSG